jgi:hypothetical protein
MVSFFISPHLPYFHVTMKINNSALLTILMIMLLALSSCLEEADDPSPNPIEDFTMIVDGKPWEASTDGPHSDDAVTVDFNTTSNLIIEAYAEDGAYISLNLVVEGGIMPDRPYRPSFNGVSFQVQYKPDLIRDSLFTNLANMSGLIQFESALPGAVRGSFDVTLLSSEGNEVNLSNGEFEVSE